MRYIAAFVSLWLLAGSVALAQVAESPAEPDPLAGPAATNAKPATTPLVSPVTLAQPAHNFLDLKNSLAIGAFGLALAADSYSTQRGLAYPQVHEVNPLARPFVGSRGGQIAYSGTGFALFAGGMYLVHRTGHHRIERIAPWVAAGWEAALAGWNMHQVALARMSTQQSAFSIQPR